MSDESRDLGNGYFAKPVLHENGLSVAFDIYQTALPDPRLVACGSVKWDGCFNWETIPNRMMHSCDPDMMDAFVGALKKCWDVAAEMLGDEAMF